MLLMIEIMQQVFLIRHSLLQEFLDTVQEDIVSVRNATIEWRSE